MDAGLFKATANVATGIDIGVIADKIAVAILLLTKNAHLVALASGIVGQIISGTRYVFVIKDGVAICFNFFFMRITVWRRH